MSLASSAHGGKVQEPSRGDRPCTFLVIQTFVRPTYIASSYLAHIHRHSSRVTSRSAQPQPLRNVSIVLSFIVCLLVDVRRAPNRGKDLD